MGNKWRLVEYSDALINSLINLFQTVFKKDLEEEFFRWQNFHNPSGDSIIKLAISERKIIGHSCLWLFNLKIFNEDILSGQSINTMVHPDYRRMGIFEKLSEGGIKEGLEKEVQFNFRFPSEITLSAAVNKLNYVKIGEIPQHIKILKGHEAFSLFTDKRVLCRSAGLVFGLLRSIGRIFSIKYNHYKIRYIRNFNKDFDDLWRKEKINYNVAVNRTSEYLNWRYIISPNKYQCIGVYSDNILMGYIVTAIRNKVAKNGLNLKMGYIVDLLCAKQDSKAIRILLAEAVNYLESEGACAVSCWMLKHLLYSRQLIFAGYLQFRSPVVFAGSVISNKLNSFKDELYDIKNWFVTIGDSDYV